MMAVAARILMAGLAIATLPLSAAAQQRVYTGAFARTYPEAARLLELSDAAQETMLDRLFADGPGTSEPLDASLLLGAAAGNPTVESIRAAMPRIAREVPQLLDILDRTLSLRDELYDIHAEQRVDDKHAAAELAIDRYLSDSRGVLPIRPKSMAMVAAENTGGGVGQRWPGSLGVARSSIWFQLAAFDALLYFSSPADQRAGMAVVVERFRQKLVSTAAAPSAIPTAPAIAPELVREHPRAAAIFGNLHLLQERLANVLTDPRVTDRRQAVEEAIAHSIDPDYLAQSESEWLLVSLRQGIYFQGGPAVGSLARNERNIDGTHMHHRTTILPGMGSGPDGDVVLPESVETPPTHEH